MIPRIFVTKEKEIITPSILHEDHLKLMEEHKALAERQEALRRDHEVLNRKLDRIFEIVLDTNRKVTRIYDAIPWIEVEIKGR